MTTPVLDLNPARLEKSCIKLPFDDVGTLAEVPVYKDRATGKVVAASANTATCIATGLSMDSSKSRLTDLLNKHPELKQVSIY